MAFAGIEDRNAVEAEMPWEDRDVPKTLYKLLSDTAGKFPNHNAVSYQIFSGPKEKAETLTWSQLQAKTTQAANMFRKLGVGPKDVVAYVLPNCNETTLTLLGGAVAGIANPINPGPAHLRQHPILLRQQPPSRPINSNMAMNPKKVATTTPTRATNPCQNSAPYPSHTV